MRRTPANGASSTGLDCWRATMHWRRSVERALEPMGLGFIPFLVLAATHVLVRRAGDAVSQQVVADYLVLDKARVSDAMRELESRGWISRGPSFPVGAWRVLISGNGRRVLRVTAKSLGDPSGGTG